MLRLKGSDNEVVEVEQYVMRHSPSIANYIKNNGGNIPEIIDIPTVDAPTLRGIIEYYEHYRDDEFVPAEDEPPRELSEFEQQFFERMYANNLLANMVTHSYELGLTRLMHAGCKFVANLAKGKSPEELRVLFEIPPDSDDEDDNKGGFFLGQGAGQNGAFPRLK